MTDQPFLSIVMCVHNEETRLKKLLPLLGFADELIIMADRCSDSTVALAEKAGARVVEGAWEIEGDRRNAGIRAARGTWILELDADEVPSPALIDEIIQTITASPYDYHDIPVDNYIGARLVRYGWGAYFGKSAYAGLFRKGAKHWGAQRVHPALTFTGRKGESLKHRLAHYVDDNLSDMLARLNRYSSLRARDLKDSGDIGTLWPNIRRVFSRFYKCYVRRHGHREGLMGFTVALCAGLYPLLSYLKARLDP